jgi:drug/metabolite transporter (DMT)-like permease
MVLSVPSRTKPAVKPFLGISFKVLSALAFTMMSAGLKLVSDRFPTGELVFFRSFCALIPLLVWLGWQGDLIDQFGPDPEPTGTYPARNHRQHRDVRRVHGTFLSAPP